jgi:hypothetical protein
MGAPKGNQFWKLRSKHGRDKLFATSKLMWEAACEYFQWCDDNPWMKEEIKTRPSGADITKTKLGRPYTIQGLCHYLDCNVQYFGDFKKNLPEGEEDFSLVVTRIEETIYRQKFEGASIGVFNSNIIARDLGLKDASSKEISGPGGGPIKSIEVVFIDAEEN